MKALTRSRMDIQVFRSVTSLVKPNLRMLNWVVAQYALLMTSLLTLSCWPNTIKRYLNVPQVLILPNPVRGIMEWFCWYALISDSVTGDH